MKRKLMTAGAVLTTLLILCGCAATQIANASVPSLLAPALGLGGALGGIYAAEGESQGTQLAAAGAAAAGAFLLGQFIENGFKEEKKKEYKAGYDLGRSNSAKELYWLYQKLHQAQDEEPQRTRIYELPVEYPDNGVKYVPDTVSISVTE